MNFTHLHLHTEYSLLDGVNKAKPLLEKIKNSGMESCAITDHGVLFGAPEFWKTAKDFDIKPIIGCEIYLSPASHTLRQEVDGIRYYHLLLLAKNLTGYKNLAKIVTIGHTDGMYYRPRVDFETLKKHSEGLICTSACLAGPLSTHIIKNQSDKAEEWLKKLHSVFGEDFYLEIQRNGLCEDDQINNELVDELPALEKEDALQTLMYQQLVNRKLYEYSDKYKIKVIATTDAHYLDANDKETQKILFCIKDGTSLTDINARNGYVDTYVKTPEEMEKTFSDIPHVLENTMEIAEKVEPFSLKFDRVQPRYWNVPSNSTAKEELRKQTYIGAEKKYTKITEELKSAIDYELEVIDIKGYNDYFLVVGDLMQFARSKGIVIGVRGSAAGSIVSYSLGITNVDPIKWGLVFERFLNPERNSPPDIDMDIQDDRRGEIIQYAKEKYGQKNVSAIVTFGTMATKAAIRDVARTMGIELQLADKLSKKVVVLFGKPYKFDEMMEEDTEFREIVNGDPRLVRLREIVNRVEGLKRQTGIHAAGYLITPEPIDEYMAMFPDPDDHEMMVSQIDGTWVDKLDFMKFDFLGLRTLTILKNTLDLVKQRHSIEIDLSKINVNPTDGEFDEKAKEIFCKGETVGVFQFESPPMQRYLIDLQPQNLEDICFMAAAYRPGAMDHIPAYISIRNGKKQAEYTIPELEPILKDTLGFPVYQEQLLKICQALGGFSLGDGDVIRNALKKKQLDILETKHMDFKKYFLDNYNYGEEIAETIWGQLKPFSDYGFNKAHAASYAAVAYWCAYLKGNYPLEFVTSLMHSDLNNPDRIVVDMKEAGRMGYSVLPPNINYSLLHFVPEDDASIRFGLGAIKGSGNKVMQRIVDEREKNGKYLNLDDLIYRVGAANLTKKDLECLIKVGALDDFGPRNSLLAVMPGIMDSMQKMSAVKMIGQVDMFSYQPNSEMNTNITQSIQATPFPQLDPVSSIQKVQWEKELLGIFLSTHPLEPYKWITLNKEFSPVSEILQMRDGTKARILCFIDDMKTIRTKRDNKPMSFITISDAYDKCEGVLFSETHLKYVDKIELSAPIIVTGSVSHRNDEPSILVDSIEPISELSPIKSVRINICNVQDKSTLSELKTCFDEETGEINTEVMYGDPSNPKTFVRKLKLEPTYINFVRKYLV